MKKENKKYEKVRKTKLSKWQIYSLIAASILFIIATVIFIVLFWQNIFNENTFAILIVCGLILFVLAGFIIQKRGK